MASHERHVEYTIRSRMEQNDAAIRECTNVILNRQEEMKVAASKIEAGKRLDDVEIELVVKSLESLWRTNNAGAFERLLAEELAKHGDNEFEGEF